MPSRAPEPSINMLLKLAESWIACAYPHAIPEKLTFKLRDPRTNAVLRVHFPVAIVLADSEPTTNEAAKHSPDFRSVNWFGVQHAFTPLQAAIVRQLWEAWENGTPDVGGDYLLENAGDDIDSRRIDLIFRDHAAWKTMIVASTRGSYRLQAPES